MQEYIGKILHGGIAIGKIHMMGRETVSPVRTLVADPEAEVSRFSGALDTAALQLSQLAKEAVTSVGEANAEILNAQTVMLSDEEFVSSVEEMIRRDHVDAGYAVAKCTENYSALLRGADDAYIRERVADLTDVSKRLTRILSGRDDTAAIKEPSIIMSLDLLPSETLQLDRHLILAFLTYEGSPLSHTAILAKGMDIPALSGIPVSRSWDGHRAVVDALDGKLVLDPDEATLAEASKKKALRTETRKKYLSLKGLDSVTSDGKPIRLFANVASLDDISSALENDAEGIGLFRTEFLYIGQRRLPDEDQQFETYKKTARMMGGRQVIIRTIDLGADKKSSLPDLVDEKNPALGFRGIRVCLTHPDLFCTQLRAIYRASAYGNLAIMFPMITSVKEVQECKKLIRKVQDQLREMDIPFREIPIGIMIETPSSVILSDALAREVDFFSIGTNDLTQYTLAMDRQNGSLDSFYDPYSEAVMREIEYTVRSGHLHGCHVGICGELGADTSMTDRLLKMGVDELSVSPHMVLPVRAAIRAANTEPGT